METIFYKGFSYDFEAEHLDLETLPEINSKDAEEILVTATDLLNQCNVSSYLAFGTLLGAVRDKDFIKGDFDVDIYTDNEEGLFKSLPFLAKHGMKLVRKIEQYTTYSFRMNENCYIDVYILSPIQRPSFWASSCLNLCGFYTPKRFFEETTTIMLKDHEYKCVANPEALLEFWYGKTWNIPIGKFDMTYKYEVASHYYYRWIPHYIKIGIHKMIGDKLYMKLKGHFKSNN